jgi:hypothetical protein
MGDYPLMANLSSLMENDADYLGFEKYLQKERRAKTVGRSLSLARQYGHVLSTGNASELLTMTPRKQQHTMAALACLAKYHGCYNVWKEIKERYQLKWSKGDSLQAFENIINEKQNFPSMIAWVKDACSKLPKPYANVLLFDCLTGLRADEACKSIALLHQDLDRYLNSKSMILEHYRYKDKFLRRTKKAYISIISDSILTLARESEPCSYDALHCALRRRSTATHIGYCRKIFGTYLRKKGIEAEIVDLLQGRISQGVFVRHYFRPDFEEEIRRVRVILAELHSEIAS